MCVGRVPRTKVSTKVSVKTANTAVIAKSKANKPEDVENAMTAAGLSGVAVRPDRPPFSGTKDARDTLKTHNEFERALRV